MKIYIRIPTITLFLILFLNACNISLKTKLNWKQQLPFSVKKGAQIESIFTNKSFFEAPVWDPNTNSLYFTSYKNKFDRLVRLEHNDKATEYKNTKGVGGTFLSSDGTLLASNCITHEIEKYKLTRAGPKKIKSLAFNKDWFQPNDLCQLKNGLIYFTDPDFKNKKDGSVYCLDLHGKIKKVISDLPTPNGIIASPNNKYLYISDSHLKEWRVYKIKKDGSLKNAKLFFKPKTINQNSPDGMTVDELGNLYLTGLGGIWVVSPSGGFLGFIQVPEFCSNLTFGGKDYKTLFITCKQKVYRLKMTVRGHRN